MPTRIKKEFSYCASVYFQDEFLINLYDVVLFMDVITDSMYEQSIAIERVKFLFENLLSDVMFINENQIEKIKSFENLGVKVCTLPEEPFDQIVGIALLTKINAITENRFLCTDIGVTSKLSDGVEFLFSIEEPIGPFETKGKWWNESYCKISDYKNTTKDKIVRLSKQKKDWDSFNLGWTKPKNEKNNRAEINFTQHNEK